MRIISVINYKGGVGKTTLTANLAGELAWRGKRILLLDMDAQCSLTFSFITPDKWRSELDGSIDGDDRTIKSWFDGISDQDVAIPDLCDLVVSDLAVNNRLRNRDGRIHLIPSHLGLINVDLDLAFMLSAAPPGRLVRQRARVYGQLRQHLRTHAEYAGYDYVLIDCPPNFNIVTKNAIIASDAILIPAKPDYLSTMGIDYLVRNYGQLLEEFNQDTQSPSVHPEILGVVFTMVQFRSGQPINAQREYMKPRDIRFFSSMIRDNKTIFSDAPETCIPVVLTGYSQRTYTNIVNELETLASEFLDTVE